MMDKFPERFLGASCTVSVNDISKSATIYALYTKPEFRNQQQARTLMEAICRHADAIQYTLRLFVGPFDDEPMTCDELSRFYKSFGFVEDGGTWRKRIPT